MPGLEREGSIGCLPTVPVNLQNALETADSTDNTDDQSVADIHAFVLQVKTAPLLYFCKDRYPCDLCNPRFPTLRKLGSMVTVG